MKTLLMGVMLFIAGATVAQDVNAKVSVTKVINVSADKVWSIVRTMDDLHLYTDIVGSVEWKGKKGTGGERVCHPPKGSGGGILNETILTFSDINRSYSYSVAGVPTKGMVNSFRVVDLGYNKSMIVWNSTYEAFVENPQMNEDQLKGFLSNTLNEILTKMALAATK